MIQIWCSQVQILCYAGHNFNMTFTYNYDRFRYGNNEQPTRPKNPYRKPAPKRLPRQTRQGAFSIPSNHDHQPHHHRLRPSLHHRPITRTPTPSPHPSRLLPHLLRHRGHRTHHGTPTTHSLPQSSAPRRYPHGLETRPPRPQRQRPLRTA